MGLLSQPRFIPMVGDGLWPADVGSDPVRIIISVRDLDGLANQTMFC